MRSKVHDPIDVKVRRRGGDERGSGVEEIRADYLEPRMGVNIETIRDRGRISECHLDIPEGVGSHE